MNLRQRRRSMQPAAPPPRYVAVLQVPSGTRLFCSDRFRDEWSPSLAYAETFRALHEAIQIAERHGGQVLSWAEANEVAALG